MKYLLVLFFNSRYIANHSFFNKKDFGNDDNYYSNYCIAVNKNKSLYWIEWGNDDIDVIIFNDISLYNNSDNMIKLKNFLSHNISKAANIYVAYHKGSIDTECVQFQKEFIKEYSANKILVERFFHHEHSSEIYKAFYDLDINYENKDSYDENLQNIINSFKFNELLELKLELLHQLGKGDILEENQTNINSIAVQIEDIIGDKILMDYIFDNGLSFLETINEIKKEEISLKEKNNYLEKMRDKVLEIN